MQFTEFKKSLITKISPVYIICGKERYLLQNCLENLINACNVTLPEMNIAYIDSQTSLEDIFVQCETLPFGSEKRMIIAKDYPLKADDIAKIEKYLNDANFTTCLVFTNLNIFNSKIIPIVNCDGVDDNIIKNKVISDLKKQNLTIDIDALNLLINFADSSITKVYSELEKLIVLAENGNITKDCVKNVCCKTDINYNIFELTDAIAKKNTTTAYLIMQKLIDDDSKSVVSFLYNYFRRLFISIASKYSTTEQIASTLGVKPYAVTIAKQQAKAIGSNKVLNALNMLENIDKNTKSTFATLEQQLYSFLFYILN